MNLLAEISSLLSLEDRVKMTVTKCFKAREMKRVAEKSFHVVVELENSLSPSPPSPYS